MGNLAWQGLGSCTDTSLAGTPKIAASSCGNLRLAAAGCLHSSLCNFTGVMHDTMDQMIPELWRLRNYWHHMMLACLVLLLSCNLTEEFERFDAGIPAAVRRASAGTA